MEENIKRLISWSKGEPYGPTQIQAHLTNFCNLKCFFCPTRALLKKSKLKKDKDLTREDWFRLIEESKKLGVKEWHICGGGEPLFNQDLAYDVLVRIKKEGFYGEMITNGTLFTAKMIRGLVEQEWDKIVFSIDGPNEKVHNSIRGVSCFDDSIKNIRLFLKYKKKLKKYKPEISFHTVVCNKNYRCLPGIFELAKNLGIQGVLFNALNIWSEDIRRLKLNAGQQNELKKGLDGLKCSAKNLGISTNIDEFQKFDLFNKANKITQAMREELHSSDDILNAPCYMPWYNLSIFADGRTQPCFILQDKGESLKDRSLKDIWYSDYFEHVRRAMVDKKLSKVCSRCNPWSFSKNQEIRLRLRNALF